MDYATAEYYVIVVDGRFLTDKKVDVVTAKEGEYRTSKDFRRAFWYQKGNKRDISHFHKSLNILRTQTDSKVKVHKITCEFGTYKLPSLRKSQQVCENDNDTQQIEENVA